MPRHGSFPVWLAGHDPRRTALRIAAVVIASTVVFGWILKPVRLFGPSMEPTFRSGQFSIVNALAYRLARPGRGDVVAVQLAGPHVLYVKRVIGLPGERLGIEHGLVTINGVALSEPYVKMRAAWEHETVMLGADEYFVIGDNRSMAIRDHMLGRVRVVRLLGKVVF